MCGNRKVSWMISERGNLSPVIRPHLKHSLTDTVAHTQQTLVVNLCVQTVLNHDKLNSFCASGVWYITSQIGATALNVFQIILCKWLCIFPWTYICSDSRLFQVFLSLFDENMYKIPLPCYKCSIEIFLFPENNLWFVLKTIWVTQFY